jgi:two-component system response regulator FixJ
MNPGHIYLIDNNRDRLETLATVLDQQRHRVYRFADACAFLDWVDYERVPEAACVLTHLNLAPLSGVDLLDVFRADHVVLPTVLIGGTSELKLAVKAMRYGSAYVLWRPFTQAMLIEVIASVLREWSESAHIAHDESGAPVSQTIEQRFASLSRRQRQVLRHVFEGNGNRAIAEALGISIKTVELHRTCMMKKMRADSLTSLIKMIGGFRHALERCS